MKLDRVFPWVAGLLALGAVLALMAKPSPVRGLDLDAMGALPVLEGGRVKPLDSVARNALLMIRSQQSFSFQGRSIGPDEWLADVMFRPEVADQQPIFVINDPDVLGMLGIKQSTDRYYPFTTLSPFLDQLQSQAASSHALDSKQRTRFQNAVVNLWERVYLYYRLKNTVALERAPLAGELSDLNRSGEDERVSTLTELGDFRPLVSLSANGHPAWLSVGEALQAQRAGRGEATGLNLLAQLGDSYAAGDPAAFSQAIDSLQSRAAPAIPAELKVAHAELVFNRVQPFYAGMVIYVLALLVLGVSWLWRPQLLQPTSFALLLAGAAVHTGGLISRIVLQGRPPVTNLYSSAVFVGWGAVILGIVLERIFRRGFGTAVAAASGFTSLIVAHHLMGDGDTMEMMRAVLDSNFWLATHVVTITIGYSGTFLAGTVAIGYTLRKHLARTLDPATTQVLYSMVYGVVCFALLFSFVGTVLGGIWADQSWGRFWGWDPKENGALLIVLWNAIILHARWGGYARERGVMTMALFGNVITSLSWFGVNMLGVGLHSYGFMENAFWALASFIGIQLALMALCLAPRQFWKRSAAEPAPAGHPSPA